MRVEWVSESAWNPQLFEHDKDDHFIDPAADEFRRDNSALEYVDSLAHREVKLLAVAVRKADSFAGDRICFEYREGRVVLMAEHLLHDHRQALEKLLSIEGNGRVVAGECLGDWPRKPLREVATD